MTLQENVKDFIEKSPEYYPFEWLRSFKLFLEQLSSGITNTAETKEAICEYTAIIKETMTVCENSDLFSRDEIAEIFLESSDLLKAAEVFIDLEQEGT